MKTLIKAHYQDPRVDTELIMSRLFVQKKEYSHGLFFVPSIVVAGLLMGFFSFLMNMNIEFFSTALSVYLAIGWILFFIFNLIIGVFFFILGNYQALLIISCLAFVLEMSMFSRMRTYGGSSTRNLP